MPSGAEVVIDTPSQLPSAVRDLLAVMRSRRAGA
jgi:hypothetical protein